MNKKETIDSIMQGKNDNFSYPLESAIHCIDSLKHLEANSLCEVIRNALNAAYNAGANSIINNK